MKIKKGDLVQVLSGDDASNQPRKVLQVLAGSHKILVEGVNRVYKHVKRGHPKSPQGGRLSKEMPLHVSKVAFYCGDCKQGVRVGFRYTVDGRKERFCKKCTRSAGFVSPPRTAYATRIGQ